MISLETDRLVIRNFCFENWQELQELAIQYRASEQPSTKTRGLPLPKRSRAWPGGLPVGTTILRPV
jgi:hypothetical protein